MKIQFNGMLIKKIRAHLQITQRELGKASGVHYVTINRIENHDTCTRYLAERLARFFQCDPMQLLMSEGQLPKNVALVESLK